MKKLTLLIFLCLGFHIVSAQDENNDDQISTLFSKNRSNGGYGAFSFSYTQINGKDAFLMGARGSWVIGHSFAIGLGGCGFVDNVDYHGWVNSTPYNSLGGGYGGLYLEPIIAPRFPVHLSFPILLGVGGITNMPINQNLDNWIPDETNSDTYLVFEPAVELEFNMTHHLRMAATFSYRITSGISMIDTDPDVLEGMAAGLIFKFGRF
jgi:hypothetical protein